MKLPLLPASFYQRSDVVLIAQELLGKVLYTNVDNEHTAGIIVETEAYKAPEDKASHAYNNRRTKRTEIMFAEGGVSYIYLCYGIHQMMNIVTGQLDQPHAILIRAVEPIVGIDIMLKRRNMGKIERRMTAGPGSLGKAMGISTHLNGVSLLSTDSPVYVTESARDYTPADIIASPRVGVDYAAECKDWPWRFRLKNSKWTSPAK